MVGDSLHPPLRVAVLLGGDSAEREISLASGNAVAAALERAGHQVTKLDPQGHALTSFDWSEFDVAFIALHGGAGEDGRVQQELESLGVPYTGSGPAASHLAMSKSLSKRRFLTAGVPTPEFARFSIWQMRDELARAGELPPTLRGLGLPLIIKPDGQGSSLGVSCMRELDELAAALADCELYDSQAVAERFISGREFTVAVLDRRALPVLEIISAEGLFTYASKYHSRATEYQFEIDLPLGVLANLQAVAVAAAEALDTAGLVRVDLMLDTKRQPWVLEVNTIPGMTERSLAPKAAARAGLRMEQLCEYLVRQPLTKQIPGPQPLAPSPSLWAEVLQ